ncbi:CipC-like protein [Gymnopilus junonius]|uniref:CipC-like protein n=1 Tax=Gymnopilus junonius TaxID=109634 RepID=A0A9P5TJX1_GYMJU|nr:CipC-like protein [Gymnopilus junonius]
MGWFDHHEDSYNEVANAGHKAQLSHELIAAAAAYEAEKAYTKHCAANGKPTSHEKAKELLAGFSAAFVDRIVETKGLDFVDKEKAKHEAKKKLHEASSADY